MNVILKFILNNKYDPIKIRFKNYYLKDFYIFIIFFNFFLTKKITFRKKLSPLFFNIFKKKIKNNSQFRNKTFNTVKNFKNNFKNNFQTPFKPLFKTFTVVNFSFLHISLKKNLKNVVYTKNKAQFINIKKLLNTKLIGVKYSLVPFLTLMLKKNKNVNKFNIKKKMSLFSSIKEHVKYSITKTFKSFKLFKKNKKNKIKLFNNYVNNYFFKKIKFEKNKSEASNRYKMFSINRIKFKNNYIKIWKNARIDFKIKEDWNLKYQKQFTRRMFKFSKFSFINFYYNFFKIKNVLKSIFYKIFDIEIFMKKKFNLLYVNGSPVYSDLIIIKNDKISVLVSINLYLFLNLLKKDLYFFKKKIMKWFLYFFKRIKYTLFQKKKKNIPKKIEKYYFVKRDIPNTIEFDYFTLTGIVICNDLLVNNFFKYDLIKYNSYVYRNYNWKFIT